MPAYLQRSGWANSPFEEAARKLRPGREDEPRRAVRLNEIDAMDRDLKAQNPFGKMDKLWLHPD